MGIWIRAPEEASAVSEASLVAVPLEYRRPSEAAQSRTRRVRVAQIVTTLTAGAGGITLRGALGLDPERFATTILAGESGRMTERAEQAGFEVVTVRALGPSRRVYPWADAPAYRELVSRLAAGRFDLVHTHSAKAGALGRLAARRAGVPVIVHSFHGFPFHEFQSPLVRRGLLTIERRLARFTDYFLTDGTVVASEAVRLKLAPPERIRAIASPIDAVPPVSEAGRCAARAALGIPQSARVVGTAARLEAQKAPGDMVEAISALRRPDVFMVWIGDGSLRAETERLALKRGLEGRFLLLGDRSDVADLLPAFDVFALSSLYEGLPCAAVEAMICGIPVVATAVNSVPEIVISGKTGLVARPGDPASLSRALGYLLDHPAEAARMAEAARAHVGDRFRPEALGEDLTEVYEIALRDSARRRALTTGRRA
jgi:glycosyltransferase involved in cell wall biosynthesis